MTAIRAIAFADLALVVCLLHGSTDALAWFGFGHTVLSLASLYLVSRPSFPRNGLSFVVLVFGAILGPAGILLVTEPASLLKFGQRNKSSFWSESFFKVDNVIVEAEADRPSDKERGISGQSLHRSSALYNQTNALRSDQFINKLLDGRKCFPDADQIPSIAGILKHGSLESRRNALETVVRSFEPKLSPLIALALADPDQTIRALAAAASAQVSANMAEKLEEAEPDVEVDVEGAFENAISLFDSGCNNILLSEVQRRDIRLRCRLSFHRINGASEINDSRRRSIRGALDYLGDKYGQDVVDEKVIEENNINSAVTV